MSGLIAWWRALSRRERWLLGVMAALLALTAVWYGVLRPLGDALSSERARFEDAAIRLGATQTQVVALHDAARHRPPPLPGSLADTVRGRAAEAGFTLADLTEDGPGRVKVTIAAARPPALLPWLARLEEAGVLVEQATLADKGDRTDAVQLTFKAASR